MSDEHTQRVEFGEEAHVHVTGRLRQMIDGLDVLVVDDRVIISETEIVELLGRVPRAFTRQTVLTLDLPLGYADLLAAALLKAYLIRARRDYGFKDDAPWYAVADFLMEHDSDDAKMLGGLLRLAFLYNQPPDDPPPAPPPPVTVPPPTGTPGENLTGRLIGRRLHDTEDGDRVVVVLSYGNGGIWCRREDDGSEFYCDEMDFFMWRRFRPVDPPGAPDG